MQAALVVTADSGFVHDGAAFGGPNRSGGDAAKGMPTYFETAAVAPESWVVVPTTTPFAIVTEGEAQKIGCTRQER